MRVSKSGKTIKIETPKAWGEMEWGICFPICRWIWGGGWACGEAAVDISFVRIFFIYKWEHFCEQRP